jgi:hypothetical protein
MRRRRVVIGLVVLAGALIAGYGVWSATRPEVVAPEPTPFQLAHDPIEDDPRVRPWLEEADREAARQMEEVRVKQGRPGEHWLGDGLRYGEIKKQFLKSKHGIDWRTPPR